jgi:predicted nucleotidyltransferase
VKFGLNDTTIQHIQSLLATHPQVEKAILYGSRAKGNFKTGSDIDLTLLGGDELNLDLLTRIMGEIDELLLPYTFDLSIFNKISDPDVIDHIRRIGVVFYERETVSSQP